MVKKKKKPQADDLNFQIEFYENLLKKNPGFIEVLIALGDIYTKKGFFQEGLEVDQRLAQLRPADPFVLYNLACSYSLLNEIDRALATIKAAFICGYDDIEYLRKDDDLVNLREDHRFFELLGDLQKKGIPKYNDHNLSV